VNLDSIVCPSCKRRTITRRDFVRAGIDGSTQCGACGKLSRLHMLGRWTISCAIALFLPVLLLYGDVFYSGHLFVVSIFFVFAAWRALSMLAFPFLALEALPDRTPLGRKQSIALAAVLLIGALTVDAFMASRFEKGEGYADAAADNLKR